MPAGSQLKRRRAWDLYLDGSEAAAVLVVSKKSTFTLEDARTALRIMSDEAAARCLNDETKRVRQLLLTTRASVAPAADAFLQGTHANLGTSDFGETGSVAVMRWEQLQQLVQDGGLGRHLTRSRRRGRSGDPNAPSFALPAWLVEERERGVGAVFDLNSPFEPAGDQPEAIKALSQGIEEGKRHQTLLGATGTVRSLAAAVSYVHPRVANRPLFSVCNCKRCLLLTIDFSTDRRCNPSAVLSVLMGIRVTHSPNQSTPTSLYIRVHAS